MKSFASKTVLFLLPVVLLVAFIMNHEVKREFAYHYNPCDCENRGAWVYDRIYKDSTPVDIVFLGSSHTMTGIQDAQIESLLYVRTGRLQHVLNLGYCRNGEEIPYVLLKDLVRKKKPRLVIIEAREKLSLNSHPVYASMAETEDLLAPPSLKSAGYFPNVYTGWLTHLSQFRSDLFGLADTVKAENYSHYGFRFSEKTDDPANLEKTAKEKLKPRPEPFLSEQLRNYPLAWTAETEKLAEENGAKVAYLYFYSFGSPQKRPELQQYQKDNTFLLPPDSVFTDKLNWRDPDHINNRGAAELANWLASELEQLK